MRAEQAQMQDRMQTLAGMQYKPQDQQAPPAMETHLEL